MGCNGEKCLWAAGETSCRGWCRVHAQKWARQALPVLRYANDPSTPMVFMIDRLCTHGQKGIFVQNDGAKLLDDDCSDCISPYMMSSCTMTMHVYGLEANSTTKQTLHEWESGSIHFNMAKRGVMLAMMNNNTILATSVPGGTFHVVSADEAEQLILNTIQDTTLVGTQLFFVFNFIVPDLNITDMQNMCDLYENSTAPDGSHVLKYTNNFRGKTFTHKPLDQNTSCSTGGAHVLMKCDDRTARWHTTVHMEVTFLKGKRRNVAFKITTMW